MVTACRSFTQRILRYGYGMLFVVCLTPGISLAQATRTWVSGVGDDANPCSRTAPCKTLAGAISKTAAGGEIDLLDPAGVGAVTITKAITIDGGAGQVGSVLVSGTSGIVVAAGANDDVILRNLSINGISAGTNGVSFTSGKTLRIQNLKIDRFSQACISITTSSIATVEIIDTIASNCVTGLSVFPSASTKVSVERSRFLFNSTAGVSATSSNAVVQLSNSTAFGNQLGISTGPSNNPGTINSFGNNQTIGNTNNGSFSATVNPN